MLGRNTPEPLAKAASLMANGNKIYSQDTKGNSPIRSRVRANINLQLIHSESAFAVSQAPPTL